SFLTARRLAREEGILAGGSAGTTVWAALQIAARFERDARILTIIPDTGRNYLSKFYDDNWMLDHGFLERRTPAPTVGAVMQAKRAEEPGVPEFIVIGSHQKVGEAVELRQRYSISQLPVVRDGASESLADVVGPQQHRDLLDPAFPSSEVDVQDRTGGGDHFLVTVASARFDGLPLLEQHRLVNQALAAPLGDGTIHELRIQTKGSQ